MGCKKQIKRLFSVTLPSATAMTLGKVTTWELPRNMLCRMQWPMHSTNITDLPSATGQALGKGRLFAECLAGGTRHSGHLCRVSESTVLGKEAIFAGCLTLTLGKAVVTVALAVTATFLCRVSNWHSAKCPIKCTRQIGLC